jgi:uncharacterized membrane protein YkoI
MKPYKALLTLLVIVMTTTVNASPLTKESAAEQVQSESGGKILSVDDKQEDGQQIFRVKVLHDDGKIKIYQLDAATGKEIK